MNNVMMHLIKHELFQLLVSLQILQDKQWKTVLLSCLYGLVFLSGLFYCGGSAFGLCLLGSSGSILPVYVNAVLMLVFMTTLMKTGHQLYGASDIKMLMSFPIPLKTILISKCSSVFLINWLISFIFLGSAGFVLGVYQGQWNVFVMSLVLCPFFVLIPMSVGILLSSWVFVLSSKSKNTTLVTIILLCGLILLMPALINGLSSASQIIELTNQLSATVHLNPLTPLAVGALNGQLFSIASLIMLALGLCWFVFDGISKNYLKVLSSMQNKSAASFSYHSQQSGSVMKALVTREFRRFFSSSLYVSNTIVGLIFGVALIITVWVVPMEELLVMIGLPLKMEQIKLMIPLLFAMVCTMCCTSASSLSLEGKSLWLIQSLPVTENQIKVSKILMNLVLNLPVVITGSVLIAVRFHMSGFELLLGLLLPVLISIFGAITGMLGNVLFQNYSWTNEVQVIKQGLSVLIGMFVPMLVSMIGIGILVVFENTGVIFLIGILILLASILEWKIIQRKPIED